MFKRWLEIHRQRSYFSEFQVLRARPGWQWSWLFKLMKMQWPWTSMEWELKHLIFKKVFFNRRHYRVSSYPVLLIEHLCFESMKSDVRDDGLSYSHTCLSSTGSIFFFFFWGQGLLTSAGTEGLSLVHCSASSEFGRVTEQPLPICVFVFLLVYNWFTMLC